MSDSIILKTIKLILSLALLVLSILCLYWLIKVYNNTDDEPLNRIKYISDEHGSPDELYSLGDICYDHYESFLIIGALEDFDIRIKKIRKFSLALIITFFISFILSILSIGVILGGAILKCAGKVLSIITIILGLIAIISTILAFIFFIILSVHYFKSNFGDFEDFNDCYYLNSTFDDDYDFVYVVKKNYKRFFIVYLIVFVLDIVDKILERMLKKKNN